MKILHMVAFTLVIVGALNWGLVGLANLNVVNMFFKTSPVLEGLVYDLVGASALVLVLTHKSDCKTCEMKS